MIVTGPKGLRGVGDRPRRALQLVGTGMLTVVGSGGGETAAGTHHWMLYLLYITDKFRLYFYSIFMCVLYKVENELFVCYTLGTKIVILIQVMLILAGTSVKDQLKFS